MVVSSRWITKANQSIDAERSGSVAREESNVEVGQSSVVGGSCEISCTLSPWCNVVTTADLLQIVDGSSSKICSLTFDRAVQRLSHKKRARCRCLRPATALRDG